MSKYAALLRASILLLLACLAVRTMAAPAPCDTKGGTSTVGAEISAREVYGDGTFLYDFAILICQNGVITTLSNPSDFQGTPLTSIQQLVQSSPNIRVYANGCGSHLIGVHKYYTGTVAGIDFSNATGPAGFGAQDFYFTLAKGCGGLSNADLANGALGENGRNCPTDTCKDPDAMTSPSVGEPITTSSGNVYNPVLDMAPAQSEGVFIHRDYNSMLVSRRGGFGRGWTGSYLQSLLLNVDTAPCPSPLKTGMQLWTESSGGGFTQPGPDPYPQPSQPSAPADPNQPKGCIPPPLKAIALRASGRGIPFDMTGGKDNSGLNYTLTVLSSGYSLRTPEDSVETYDSNGLLQSISYLSGRSLTLSYNASKQLLTVQDSYGRTLSYQYNGQGYISQITDPAGKVYAYSYDANDNLIKASYPDNTSIGYLYELSTLPNLLTGDIDQKGIRFDTWAYDSQGRGISSELLSGINKTSVDYSNPATPVVTTPLGVTQTQTLVSSLGVARVGQLNKQCTGCTSNALTYSYNSNGNLISISNWRGIQTTLQYDAARNLETSRTEAAGTAQARTITTVWHPSFRLPALISEPGRSTAYTYDSKGNLLTLAVTDTSSGKSRTWTYTYNARSQPLSLKDPLNRTTQLSYDAAGNLISVTNAQGQTTSYGQYTPLGQAGRITDANGRITTLSYDARSRLLSSATGSEVTTYGYDAIGNLITASLPSGVALSYQYDNAHRLTGIRDSQGNAISYTLDAAGNRIREVSTDATGQLASNMAIASQQRNLAPALPAPPPAAAAVHKRP